MTATKESPAPQEPVMAQSGKLAAAVWFDLSHELRTPLNAILGNAELLLEGSAGPLSDQARACLGDMQTAGQHLMRRVEGMLLIAQAKAGTRPAAAEPIDVIELFRQAHATAHGSRAQARLAMQPADARFRILGDPSWLELLATTLVEVHAATGPERGALAIAIEPPHYQDMTRCVRIESASFELGELASTQLHLVEAILDHHDGAVEQVQGLGVRLVWPTSRVVEAG